MNIDKDKIIKYTGIGVLLFATSFGTGIAIHDATVDHTKNVCSITDLLSIPVNLDGKTLGVMHQVSQMTKEFEKMGIDAEVSFVNEYHITSKQNKYSKPSEINFNKNLVYLLDSNIVYSKYDELLETDNVIDTRKVIVVEFEQDNNIEEELSISK